MLTEKENLMRMYHGEMPEFLPRGGFTNARCSYFVDCKAPGYHIDEFGVECQGKDGIFDGTPIPIAGRYVIHDITKWRDELKFPSLEGIDWETLAKKDLAHIDRSQKGVTMYYGKTFQRLMDFMGFEEGLCAMFEEPDAVYELFDALTDYHVELIKNLLYYYKPDSICIPDDTATARAPFISVKTYRELVKPFHKRIADVVLDSGALLEMHDCGVCQDFIDDWLDLGVCCWNPAQPQNDLPAIKAKYGRKLVIAGGWDSQGPESFPEYDDDLFLEKLREYTDRMAPGGGFIFTAHVSGNRDDPMVQHKNELVAKFYNDYARSWYQTH